MGNGMEGKPKIELRKAEMKDKELLFAWKNDKETMKNSLSGRGVTKEEHETWLENTLKNPNRLLYIAEMEKVPIGQLRLDISFMSETGDEKETDFSTETEKKVKCAEISYGLGEEFRHKGYGRLLLMQAEALAKRFNIALLTAEVMSFNQASRKLFKKLGFAEEKKEDIYVYRKRYQ